MLLLSASIPIAAQTSIIRGCTPIARAGDVICVCGSFTVKDSGNALTLDGEPLGAPLSAGANVLLFRLPQEISSGQHWIGGSEDAGFSPEDRQAFTVISIAGEIDRDKLRRGESTSLRLQVYGTKERIRLHLTNRSPEIISVEGGAEQSVVSTGGITNIVERTVRGLRPGNFDIDYKPEVDPCSCAQEAVSPSDQDIPSRLQHVSELVRQAIENNDRKLAGEILEDLQQLGQQLTSYSEQIPLETLTTWREQISQLESSLRLLTTSTRVRPPPQPPKQEAPPTRERPPKRPPELSPPTPPPTSTPPPPTFYGEELAKKCVPCAMVGNSIFFVRTTDFLNHPRGYEEYEAYNNPSLKAYNLLSHDNSFFEQQLDMFTKAPGFDFTFLRTYRSAVKTDGGGIIGSNWDLDLDKRILPLGGLIVPNTGLKVETGSFGDMEYRNGTGRVDRMKFVHAEIRKVKNFKKIFEAHVSTYRPPPGLFAELERYVVKDGYEMPFADHPNFEGRLFYVMRYKDGYQEIFNCRGEIIYALDRHSMGDESRNFQKFEYKKNSLNPLTQRDMLWKITDTAGRTYKVEHIAINEGKVETNYYGKYINETKPILRIRKITDLNSNRWAEFSYTQTSEPDLIRRMEVRGNIINTDYQYKEPHLLAAVTAPQPMETYIENTYEKDGDRWKVTDQKYELGSFKIEGPSVTDALGNKDFYNMGRVSGYPVLLSHVEQEDEGDVTTRYDYNGDLQITHVTYPNGNESVYEYKSGNDPIAPPIGDVVDWMERKWTYENDLSKGNLLKETHSKGAVKHELDYDAITVEYEYEPRFNSLVAIRGPGSYKETRTYNHGWWTNSGNNGNPLETAYDLSSAPSGKAISKRTYTENGLLETETNAEKDRTVFTYDIPRGQLLSIMSPIGTISFQRDIRGNMISMTDVRGVSTNYDVNLSDQVTREIQDVTGFRNEIDYKYDDVGNTIEIRTEKKDNPHTSLPKAAKTYISKQSSWIKKTFQYNRANDPVQERNEGEGASFQINYTYDAAGNNTVVTRPMDDQITLEYTKRGFLKSTTTPEGGTVKNTYDKNGNLIAVTDGRGATTQYVYDGFDRLYKTIYVNGTVEMNSLNPDGTTKETKITGPNHAGQNVLLKDIQYTNDEMGNIISAKEAILDSLGKQRHSRNTSFERDAIGRIKKIETNGKATAFVYERGQKRLVTDPLGNETVYEYDGDLVASVTSNERGKKFSIDSRRGAIVPKEEENRVTYIDQYTYDSLGRLVRSVPPSGLATSYMYDSLGNQRIQVDPGPLINVFQYDGLARQNKISRFANVEDSRIDTDITFDEKGRSAKETTKFGGGRKVETSYWYEKSKLSIYTNQKLRSFEKDQNNNIVAETYPNGFVLRREYDLMNQLVLAKTQGDPSPIDPKLKQTLFSGLEGEETDQFQYDGLGRIVSAQRARGGVVIKNLLQYSSLGDVLKETQDVNGNAYTFEYESNDDGLRSKMIHPSLPGLPRLTLTYEYDALGRLRTIDSPNGIRFPGGLDYFDRSHISRKISDSVLHTLYDYDSAGRLKHLDMTRLGTDLLYQTAFEYNPKFGNISVQGIRRSDHTDEIHEILYSPWGVPTSIRIVATSSNPDTHERTVQSRIRRNYYQNGLLVSSIDHSHNWRRYKASTFGFNEENRGSIEVTKLGYEAGDAVVNETTQRVYDGSTVWRGAFANFFTTIGNAVGKIFTSETSSAVDDLPWKEVEDIANGETGNKPSLDTKTTIERDRNNRILNDDRYTYLYDYKDMVRFAWDRYPTLLTLDQVLRGVPEQYKEYGVRSPDTEGVKYYYDYLNRPVLLVWTAELSSKLTSKHRRFLYDGMSLVADLRTDESGKGLRTLVRYITHPETSDIFHMSVFNATENRYRAFLPGFADDGELIAVTNDLGKLQQISYELSDEDDLKARSRPVIQGTDMEIPITGVGTMYDPFTGNVLSYTGMGLMPDYQRNHWHEWTQFINYKSNKQFQEELEVFKTHVMIALAPLVVATAIEAPALLLYSAAWVFGEFMVFTTFDWDYTLKDAVFSFETGLPLLEAPGFAAKVFGEVGEAALRAALKRMFSLKSTLAVARNSEAFVAPQFLTFAADHAAAIATARGIESNFGKIRFLKEAGIPDEDIRWLMKEGHVCFVAGTPVLMADGTHKAIEKIKQGDWVATRMEGSSQVIFRQILQTSVNTTAKLVTVHFALRQKIPKAHGDHLQSAEGDDADPGGELTASEDHPFWVVNQGWTPARDLKPQNQLILSDSQTATITKVDIQNVDPTTVYNFTVDGTNTYFVGTENVWVHNNDGCSQENAFFRFEGTKSEFKEAAKRKDAYLYVFEVRLEIFARRVLKIHPKDILSKGEDVHFKYAAEALEMAMARRPEFGEMMRELIPDIDGVLKGPRGGRPTKIPGWTWEHVHSSMTGISKRRLGRYGVLRLVPTKQHTAGSPWWRLLHPMEGAAGGYSELRVRYGAPKRK